MNYKKVGNNKVLDTRSRWEMLSDWADTSSVVLFISILVAVLVWSLVLLAI